MNKENNSISDILKSYDDKIKNLEKNGVITYNNDIISKKKSDNNSNYDDKENTLSNIEQSKEFNSLKKQDYHDDFIKFSGDFNNNNINNNSNNNSNNISKDLNNNLFNYSNSYHNEKDNNNYQNLNIDSKKKKFYFSYEKRLCFLCLICFSLIIVFILVLKSSITYKKNHKALFIENSNSTYSVCLNENAYYEESCLDEAKQYVTRLVKEIPYVFSYNSSYEYKVDKIYKYRVDAHIKIFSQDNDSQVLYEKVYSLLEEKRFDDKNNVFTLSDSVVIPFEEYNNLVEKYSNDYSLLSNAEVIVDFYVDDKSVSSLTIPLNKQTFSIVKRDTNNSMLVDSVLEKVIKRKSSFYNLFLIILGVLIITLVIIITLFLFKYRRKNDDISKYKNELSKLLKNYDRIIVEVKDIGRLFDNKLIIKVDSFLELVDVRDTLDKPILHVKINNIKDGFYVDDGNKIYSFVMKSK